MNRALLILPLALTLQGCWLDKIDNPSEPSPSQQAMLNRQALISEPAPVFEVTGFAISEPPCVATFRVNRCGPDGEELPW